MSTNDETSLEDDLLRPMWLELRREVAVIAKATGGMQGAELRFPDPAVLDAIERRMLAKSVFSFIEALTYALKAVALEGEIGRERMSAAEHSLAIEETYELNENGKAVTRRARLRTLANSRFAFELFAKAHGARFSLDVSDPGWQCVTRALKVRDRLMHPKRIMDLDVRDDEVRDTLQAFLWFETQITSLFLISLEATQAEAGMLKEREAALRSEAARIHAAAALVKKQESALRSEAAHIKAKATEVKKDAAKRGTGTSRERDEN